MTPWRPAMTPRPHRHIKVYKCNAASCLPLQVEPYTELPFVTPFALQTTRANCRRTLFSPIRSSGPLPHIAKLTFIKVGIQKKTISEFAFNFAFWGRGCSQSGFRNGCLLGRINAAYVTEGTVLSWTQHCMWAHGGPQMGALCLFKHIRELSDNWRPAPLERSV